ncbi:MAG: sugar phosphate isomerase/epimerase, partial [Desulfobacterales bacterium]|nr:sugar phosphate isomerase/epimerase [Desulfobacterales bacterium]
MRLGISSYTYTWAVGVPGKIPENPLTPFDLIDKASGHGLNCLQIADNMPLHRYSNDVLYKIKQYADSRKVALEVGTRGLTLDNLDRYLKIAVILNSPILRMVIDLNDYEPCLDECIRTIQDFSAELERHNIKLAIENHDRFKAREFEKLVRASGSAWVGICLDSVNSIGAGEGIETVTEMLAPYTINLHIKEYTVKRIYHSMG